VAVVSGLGLPLRHPATLIATWFGSGLMPWAPGSWGSLAALPFAWVIGRFGGGPGLVLAAAILFLLGWWASNVAISGSGVADPGAVVVDEVVGQWLTLSVAPVDPLAYAVGFLLFRLFDIWKPFPASWADRRVKGGLGIMLDDVFAGIYAAFLLGLGRYYLGL
jgi:phosphatidylglycerophosphatase A